MSFYYQLASFQLAAGFTERISLVDTVRETSIALR